MASPTLPPVSSLSNADEQTIKGILDVLFEPSPEIHAIVLSSFQQQRLLAKSAPSFSSYPSMIEHVGALMTHLAQSSSSESREKLHSILGSHPRLGAKKVDSAQSLAEQAQLNTGGLDEAAKLKALNEEYEAKFPGLRYVVFVNGRSRPVIMENMRKRIDRGDIRAEELEAIKAMVDIALDRAKKLDTES